MGCRQVGKASDFDSDTRRFESCHPIQLFDLNVAVLAALRLLRNAPFEIKKFLSLILQINKWLEEAFER